MSHTLVDQFMFDMRGRLADTTRRHYRWTLDKIDHLPMNMDEARAFRDRRMDEVSAATVCTDLRAIKAFDRWYAEEHDEPELLNKLKFPKVIVNEHAPIATAADKEALLAT